MHIMTEYTVSDRVRGMTGDYEKLHVVLGAGPAGSTIVQELVSRGLPVRHVSLGPIPDSPTGVQTVQADMSSPSEAIAANEGAAAIYHAVNVPYHMQVEVMPQIANAVLEAAARHGAHLVVLDTLYPYGEADGAAITEQTPWAATSRKGQMRAALDRNYLDAHEAGQVRVSIGRSADFYGPRVINSTLGGAFFPAAMSGEPAIGFGDITLPHSYSYVPDIASGLVDLGTAGNGFADGRIWHLPTAPAVSTQEVHRIVGQILNRRVIAEVLDTAVPVGPFDATFMKEYEEMFYQHVIAQHMISTPFEQHFDRQPTSLADGLRQTVAWYRSWLSAQTPA